MTQAIRYEQNPSVTMLRGRRGRRVAGRDRRGKDWKRLSYRIPPPSSSAPIGSTVQRRRAGSIIPNLQTEIGFAISIFVHMLFSFFFFLSPRVPVSAAIKERKTRTGDIESQSGSRRAVSNRGVTLGPGLFLMKRVTLVLVDVCKRAYARHTE